MKDVIIGVFGVSDSGKSTLVENVIKSKIKTYKKEALKGITMKVGYGCYKNEKGFNRYFLDAPGHASMSKESFRNIELLDFCVYLMDCNSLGDPFKRKNVIESYNSHLTLLKHYQIPYIIVLNKAEYYSKEQISGFLDLIPNLKDLVGVIPCTASSEDLVTRLLVPYLEEKLKEVKIKDRDLLFRTIKSFNTNKQNKFSDEIVGGILGGFCQKEIKPNDVLFYWDCFIRKWCTITVKKVKEINTRIKTLETLEDPFFFKNDRMKGVELYESSFDESYLVCNKTYGIKMSKIFCELKKTEKAFLLIKGNFRPIFIKKHKKDYLEFSFLEEVGPLVRTFQNSPLTIFKTHKDLQKLIPAGFGTKVEELL